ncbi:hypothetical protein IVB36_15200 [Bradyrhizobium sp. 35]|uniref:hypothetical protein n=1 Tax=Bradyrhizobium sp. 35 TaxID=2782670 RepID=UPI001FF91D03|nr:hypothetical protein [Bradyrhizobium sp. 35]MCK1452199.1 hypothetical protein [Bradyrhizobium sp. 35]
MSNTARDERNCCGSPNKNVKSHLTFPNSKCARSRTKREPLNSQRRSHALLVCRLCADGHDASSRRFSIAMSSRDNSDHCSNKPRV